MEKTPQTLDGLRAALFATLDGLRDGSLEVERAEAINTTAQTIINSAKVEVDHARHTNGRTTSRFLGVVEGIEKPKEDSPDQSVEKVPGGRVITHRLRG